MGRFEGGMYSAESRCEGGAGRDEVRAHVPETRGWRGAGWGAVAVVVMVIMVGCVNNKAGWRSQGQAWQVAGDLPISEFWAVYPPDAQLPSG